jgi:hypothetical protein
MADLTYTSYAPSYARNIKTKPEGITFVIDSVKIPVNVIILEDQFEDELYFAAGSKAETNIEFDTNTIYDNIVTHHGNKIKSLRKNPILVSVQTKYLKGVESTIRSSYGRGTTAADKKSGDTTLEFHEAQHATEALDFIHKNQVPDVIVKAGMTMEKAQEAMEKFTERLAVYVSQVESHHIAKVDCVGINAKFCSK